MNWIFTILAEAAPKPDYYYNPLNGKFIQRHHISLHCLKGVQIRSFFWAVFSRIQTEYGEIGLNTERYGVTLRIQSECRKIQPKKNSISGHFLCSDWFCNIFYLWYYLIDELSVSICKKIELLVKITNLFYRNKYIWYRPISLIFNICVAVTFIKARNLAMEMLGWKKLSG